MGLTHRAPPFPTKSTLDTANSLLLECKPVNSCNAGESLSLPRLLMRSHTHKGGAHCPCSSHFVTEMCVEVSP